MLPPPEEGLQAHGAAWQTPMVSRLKKADNATYLNIALILSYFSNGLFCHRYINAGVKQVRGMKRQDLGAYRAEVAYSLDSPSRIKQIIASL